MAKAVKRKAPNAQRTKTYAQLLALTARSERPHMSDQRKIIALERKILALEKKTQKHEKASVGDLGERLRRARERMIKPA
jgi:hypothetical protein